MSKDNGGPALHQFCAKVGCAHLAIRYQGHQWLCSKHYRFGQMRAHAKRHGKEVPSEERLEGLVGPTFRCGDCGEPMNWLAATNQQRVVTLQHYRDGTFGLVCRSCNTRHAAMPGDSFRNVPYEHKFCPKCKAVKPFADFAKDHGRSGPIQLKSWCKQCSSEAHREWRNSKAA